MTPPTRETARLLAEAARPFAAWLGPVTPEALLGLVREELGHEEALERFIPRGPRRQARAVAPALLLHIVSGNTPHAGLQSLLRGLLLGSHNRCKLPSGGLPELDAFRATLPEALAARVEFSRTLPEAWLAEADAVIAFGSDETVQAIRRRLGPHQIFQPHGHRLSFGIVFDDPSLASAEAAARDASLFGQEGCLSPHLFYVAPAQAEAYAARLAGAMAAFPADPSPLSPEQAAQIAAVRGEYAFRAATEPGVRLWQSEGSLGWTVALDPRPEFTVSCLRRTVFVKPLPEDLPAALARVRPHLSTAGIFPLTPENAARAFATGISRVCPLGAMQAPPLAWHQDGAGVLAPLVRWLDLEGL